MGGRFTVPYDDDSDEELSFTDAEITALKQLAADTKVLRRMAAVEKSRKSIEYSGDKRLCNFRLDTGLWDAFAALAAKRGLSQTQAVTRAIEAYLGARTK